jgi:hypothetical protein
MNGPQRLLETEGGPLAEALKQARGRVAHDAKLSQIASGLAGRGIPIDRSAIPASATASPGAWSLGAKVAAGVGGVLALVTLGALLRSGSTEIASKAAPGSETRGATVASATVTSEQQGALRPRVGQTGQAGGAQELAAEGPAAAPEALAAHDSPPPEPVVTGDPPKTTLAPPPATEDAVPSRERTERTAPRSGSPSAPVTQSTGQSFAGPSAPAGKEEEIALLKEARAALAASPTQALALTERHRSDYPRGALVQEREVIAITALARLGQTSSARQRAERFRSAYPRSAYLKQIDRVLGER